MVAQISKIWKQKYKWRTTPYVSNFQQVREPTIRAQKPVKMCAQLAEYPGCAYVHRVRRLQRVHRGLRGEKHHFHNFVTHSCDIRSVTIVTQKSATLTLRRIRDRDNGRGGGSRAGGAGGRGAGAPR